nr:hypothetical protein [Pseudomonas syringae pv. actinidiae]
MALTDSNGQLLLFAPSGVVPGAFRHLRGGRGVALAVTRFSNLLITGQAI